MNAKLLQTLAAVRKEYDEGLISDEIELDDIVQDLEWLAIELEEELDE